MGSRSAGKTEDERGVIHGKYSLPRKKSGNLIRIKSHLVEGTFMTLGFFTKPAILGPPISLTAAGNPVEFFSGNNFYTTAANRMARKYLPEAVTGKDVVEWLQKM